MTIFLKCALIFALFGKILPCKEEKVTGLDVLDRPYERCKGIACEMIHWEVVTNHSTIVCSNINFLKDISYSYRNQPYDQSLKITNSRIPTIEAQELQKFSTITRLTLAKLQIQKILPGAFGGLTNLKELYLNDNRLKELSHGVYNSLKKLEVLDLTNNRIFRVVKFSLDGLVNLRELYLRVNNISRIEEGVLGGLERLKLLDVSENPLQKLPFLEVADVEVLNLAGGLLESFDEDLSKSTMKLLNLSNCQISAVDFVHFPRSNQIDLTNNNIEVVENCQFLDAAEVTFDNNSVSAITGNCGNTSRFSIRNNNLKELRKIFSYSRSLSSLDYSNNRISKIANNFFDDMTALELLNLNHNEIKSINSNLFRHLTSLIYLDLSHNQIDSLQIRTFDSLVNLELLDISHNELVALHEDTFRSLISLETLYFHNNKISSFDLRSIALFPELKRVSFEQNMWLCKDLLTFKEFLELRKIEIKREYSYDIDNIVGVACSNSNIEDTTTLPAACVVM